MKFELTHQQKKLFEWVKEQHGDQKRKYTGEPYWYHLYNVARTVSKYENSPIIEIALCHDLLEDTQCDSDQLSDYLFQCQYSLSHIDIIVEGVVDLTDIYTHEDFPEWNRERRKREENRRMRGITGWAQTVKYADIIDNRGSIVSYDPGFAVKYIEEAVELLRHIRMGNIHLLIECGYTLYQAKIDLEIL